MSGSGLYRCGRMTKAARCGMSSVHSQTRMYTLLRINFGHENRPIGRVCIQDVMQELWEGAAEMHHFDRNLVAGGRQLH